MTLRIVQAGRLHQLVRIEDSLLLRNLPDLKPDHSSVFQRKESADSSSFRLT